jgi:hypothetical protein
VSTTKIITQSMAHTTEIASNQLARVMPAAIPATKCGSLAHFSFRFGLHHADAREVIGPSLSARPR